jgi:hypothetical protein
MSLLPHHFAQSDCLVTDRQGQGDTRLTLTPSVIPDSNCVIMVSEWNGLKYFCVFLYCNHQVLRLGSRLRGYHPVAPSPFKVRALCAPPLVPPVISRDAPRQATWETSVSEGRNWLEMAGQYGLRFRLSLKSQGSFTCRKSATWDRRLYFPSEGRHTVDFFARTRDLVCQRIFRCKGTFWSPCIM